MSRKLAKLIGAAFTYFLFTTTLAVNLWGGESRIDICQYSFPPSDGGAHPLFSIDGVTWQQGLYKWEQGQGEDGVTPAFTKYYRCKYTDLRLFTVHNRRLRPGIKFRLIVPENLFTEKKYRLDSKYPLYLSFNYKATEREYPHPNLMEIAEEGIIVASTSMRGHVQAYKENDPLYGRSDWKGAWEMMDFDYLLWCFIEGKILPDELPEIDPTRIGIGGASMGGITTFVYGRWTQIPEWTQHPLRVALPGGCAPSMGDWFYPGLDRDDRENFDPDNPNINISTFGSIRLSGLTVQVAAFWDDEPENGHPFFDNIVDWIEGDVNRDDLPTASDFQKFEKYCAKRSGYDNYPICDDVTSFLNNVQYGLLRIGCQDSVMPRGPIYDFYEKLRTQADDPDRFKLISTVGYHLGSKGMRDEDCYMTIPPAPYSHFYPPGFQPNTVNDCGYYPRCTVEMMKSIQGWSFTRTKEFLVHYLVSPLRYPNVTAMPKWLFMFANNALISNEIPLVHKLDKSVV